jgi:FtsP/CotA-like multicopper oxidase with cupredoxin domain
LTVAEGTCVQVTLHNDLAEATSLALHGQGLAADTAGASASGGSKVYTFSATQPGTFLYEAGLTLNGARQVGMGLYGALIVQPATAPTTYSSEAVLVLSEIDVDLAANPTGFDMGEYKPDYWLINGQGYASIPDLSIASGSTALIRYVNAGLNENSMGLLGLDQTVVAADGYAVPAYTVVAETIPPGATLDTLVTISGAAAVGTRYPLYSTAQHLDNNGAAYGGQLMFIAVTAAPPPIAPAPAPVDVTGDKLPNPPTDPTPPPVPAETPVVDVAPVDVNKDIKRP